ncbi:alpha/beta fold hydrolase [Candidatus Zixiibacteriota bacterium]
MHLNIRNLSILLIWMLALAGTLLISCQNEADTPSVATGPVVDSVASADSVMIHYEVVGEGEPTLVFVHGWNCDRGYWKYQVDEFAKTYRVVTIDMGGHGESGLGRENWTVAAFGADVAAVVNKLNPDKVVMIGHSMAGSVIIQATMLLPGRVIGLVGVDTYQELEVVLSPEQMAGMTAPFRADFVAAVDGFVRSMFHQDADSALVDQIVTDMSAAPPEVAVSALENYISGNPAELLQEVRVPIRAINSDKWPTNLETNRKHAASFEMKLMPGTGHFVMLEDPATFNRLLHETLDELTGKSGAPVDVQ